MDYYQLLGVPSDADGETIKRAYRRLAREHHPDHQPSKSADGEHFKRVSEAYRVLSDRDSRAKYDRERRRRRNKTDGFAGRASFTHHRRPRSDLFDIFDFSWFDFGPMFPDASADLEIILSRFEAANGCLVPLEAPVGGSFELAVPAGIHDGDRGRFRLPGSSHSIEVLFSVR